jgi:hypothetical protein
VDLVTFCYLWLLVLMGEKYFLCALAALSRFACRHADWPKTCLIDSTHCHCPQDLAPPLRCCGIADVLGKRQELQILQTEGQEEGEGQRLSPIAHNWENKVTRYKT